MYATESLAYLVAGVMDKGQQDYQIEAAISKVEGAWEEAGPIAPVSRWLSTLVALEPLDWALPCPATGVCLRGGVVGGG
jgi:hypothetical protein